MHRYSCAPCVWLKAEGQSVHIKSGLDTAHDVFGLIWQDIGGEVRAVVERLKEET